MKKLILIGSSIIIPSLVLAGGKCQEEHKSSELKPIPALAPETKHSIDDKPTDLPKVVERKPAVGDVRKTNDEEVEDLAIEARLVESLAGADAVQSVAEISSVNCSDQKCTIEAASLSEDITAMQPVMLEFFQAHREYGETITFYQDETDNRITFFVITK